MGKEELGEILEESRRNNEANGITGLLIYCREHFIQVLEGPGDSVEETFGRIAEDDRHRNVAAILREPIDRRFFNDWSMAFRELPDSAPITNPALDAVLAQDEQSTIKIVKELFEIFQKGLSDTP